MNNLRRRMMMGLASLPPKEETTEIVAPAKGFFERNAANGNQFTYPIIRGGVKEIRGNTLAWNQLITNGDFNGSRTGWSTNGGSPEIAYSDNKLIITVPDESTTYLTLSAAHRLNSNTVINHKYFYYIDCKLSKAGTYIPGNFYLSGASNQYFGSVYFTGNRQKIIGLVTADTNRTNIIIGPRGNSISEFVNGDSFEIYHVFLVDLTLMFGAGNEPTVEEFEAMFPLDYYAQDSGRLINFNGEELVSKDANGNTIGRIVLNPSTWTGKLNGEGESVTVFPDGMRSAGNGYDSIEKVDGQWWGVVNMASVDLGTLGWNYSVNSVRFYATLSSNSTNYLRPTKICSRYIYYPITYGDTDRTYKVFAVNNANVFIRDDSYTDAATFKASLSGVMLNYELETPQRYLLDPIYQAYLNALYKVEQGGMEYILPSNTSTPYTSPAKIDMKYTSISDRKRSGLPNVVSEPKVYDAEIEYLESSGTQYIDTGYKPNNNSIIHAKYKLEDEAKTAFAVRWSESPTYDTFGSYVSTVSTTIIYYGRYNSGKTKQVAISSSNIANIIIGLDEIIANDISYDITRDAFASTYPIYLFGMNTMGRFASSASTQFYAFKIVENNTVVLDLIPVRIGTTGYLYDKVSGKLFGNAGTGNFILGPDKQ